MAINPPNDHRVTRRGFMQLAAITLGALAFRPRQPELLDNNRYSRIFDDEILKNNIPILDYKDAFSFYSHFKLTDPENNQLTRTMQNKLNVNKEKLTDASVSWLVETDDIDTRFPNNKLWGSVDKNNTPKSEIALINTKDGGNYIAYSDKNHNVCFIDANKINNLDSNIISCSIIKGGCIQIFTENKCFVATFDGVDNFTILQEVIDPQHTFKSFKDSWNGYQNVHLDSKTRIIYTNDLRLYEYKSNSPNAEVKQLKSGETESCILKNALPLFDKFNNPVLFTTESGVGYFNLDNPQDETQRHKLNFSFLKAEQDFQIASDIDVAKLYAGLGYEIFELVVHSDVEKIQDMLNDPESNLPIGIISFSFNEEQIPWIIIVRDSNGSIILKENKEVVSNINNRTFPELPTPWRGPYKHII